MPKYQINKTILCNLIVECADENAAKIWASKIVAAIEDENGTPIDSNEFESFEAETIKSDIEINIFD